MKLRYIILAMVVGYGIYRYAQLEMVVEMQQATLNVYRDTAYRDRNFREDEDDLNLIKETFYNEHKI